MNREELSVPDYGKFHYLRGAPLSDINVIARKRQAINGERTYLNSEQEKYYPAHRVVLSAASAIWKEELERDGERSQTGITPSLNLSPGVDHVTLEYLLELIYTGQTTIPEGDEHEKLRAVVTKFQLTLKKEDSDDDGTEDPVPIRPGDADELDVVNTEWRENPVIVGTSFAKIKCGRGQRIHCLKNSKYDKPGQSAHKFVSRRGVTTRNQTSDARAASNSGAQRFPPGARTCCNGNGGDECWDIIITPSGDLNDEIAVSETRRRNAVGSGGEPVKETAAIGFPIPSAKRDPEAARPRLLALPATVAKETYLFVGNSYRELVEDALREYVIKPQKLTPRQEGLFIDAQTLRHQQRREEEAEKNFPRDKYGRPRLQTPAADSGREGGGACCTKGQSPSAKRFRREAKHLRQQADKVSQNVGDIFPNVFATAAEIFVSATKANSCQGEVDYVAGGGAAVGRNGRTVEERHAGGDDARSGGREETFDGNVGATFVHSRTLNSPWYFHRGGDHASCEGADCEVVGHHLEPASEQPTEISFLAAEGRDPISLPDAREGREIQEAVAEQIASASRKANANAAALHAAIDHANESAENPFQGGGRPADSDEDIEFVRQQLQLDPLSAEAKVEAVISDIIGRTEEDLVLGNCPSHAKLEQFYSFLNLDSSQIDLPSECRYLKTLGFGGAFCYLGQLIVLAGVEERSEASEQGQEESDETPPPPRQDRSQSQTAKISNGSLGMSGDFGPALPAVMAAVRPSHREPPQDLGGARPAASGGRSDRARETSTPWVSQDGNQHIPSLRVDPLTPDGVASRQIAAETGGGEKEPSGGNTTSYQESHEHRPHGNEEAQSQPARRAGRDRPVPLPASGGADSEDEHEEGEIPPNFPPADGASVMRLSRDGCACCDFEADRNDFFPPLEEECRRDRTAAERKSSEDRIVNLISNANPANAFAVHAAAITTTRSVNATSDDGAPSDAKTRKTADEGERSRRLAHAQSVRDEPVYAFWPFSFLGIGRQGNTTAAIPNEPYSDLTLAQRQGIRARPPAEDDDTAAAGRTSLARIAAAAQSQLHSSNRGRTPDPDQGQIDTGEGAVAGQTKVRRLSELEGATRSRPQDQNSLRAKLEGRGREAEAILSTETELYNTASARELAQLSSISTDRLFGLSSFPEEPFQVDNELRRLFPSSAAGATPAAASQTELTAPVWRFNSDFHWNVDSSADSRDFSEIARSAISGDRANTVGTLCSSSSGTATARPNIRGSFPGEDWDFDEFQWTSTGDNSNLSTTSGVAAAPTEIATPRAETVRGTASGALFWGENILHELLPETRLPTGTRRREGADGKSAPSSIVAASPRLLRTPELYDADLWPTF